MHTDTIILKLTDSDGKVGYGEASLPPYLGDDVAGTLEFLQGVDVSSLEVDHPGASVERLAKSAGGAYRAALAGINIALHDLSAKREGANFGVRLGLGSGVVNTTYTIGHSTEAELRGKLEDAHDFGLIKLKLGSSDDRSLVNAFRNLSTKPFCVDVNQGWKSDKDAEEMCRLLFELGCVFVEQPFPVGAEEETERLRAAAPLPIIADESVRDVDDFRRVGKAFDGVNVKLMKSRGLDGALELIDHVRGAGKYLVVGCMAESSCAATAASYLAHLADWADLDGPLLMENDPFRGLEYRKGQVHIPRAAGMGVDLVRPI